MVYFKNNGKQNTPILERIQALAVTLERGQETHKEFVLHYCKGDTSAPDLYQPLERTRPAQGDGIVEAFRREMNEKDLATFHLSGIDASVKYAITDLDLGRFTSLIGSELTEHGLPVVIQAKPGALVVRYRRLSGAAAAMAAPGTE